MSFISGGATTISAREKERLLQPVYIALERRNYNRAIKLSFDKQICCLPITIALRAHALERSGLVDEAIRALSEDLLAVKQQHDHPWEECESTISVMAITLKSCRQYETLTQMYGQAVEAGESRSRRHVNQHHDLHSLHHKNLMGLFTAHLRLALQLSFRQQGPDWMTLKLDLSSALTPNESSSPPYSSLTQDSIQKMANCYEAMQAAARKLAKDYSNTTGTNRDGDATNSGNETLYWSWTVLSMLLHCEALQQLLRSSSSFSEDQITLLRQKCEMLLPKLAETLCRTKLLAANAAPASAAQVRGEDWKLYLRSLVVQSKHSEALHVLAYQMTASPPLTESPSNNKNNSSSSAVMLQLSERERKELLIQFSFEAKDYSASMEYCKSELLNQETQQWSCWMGLLTNSIYIHDTMSTAQNDDEQRVWKDCEAFVQECCCCCHEESAATTSSPTRNSSRSRRLFQVQLAATKFERSFSSPSSSFHSLLAFQNSILAYIDAFAFDASCVYHDLKPFLKLWTTNTVILFTTSGGTSQEEEEHHNSTTTLFLKKLCSLRLTQQQQQGVERHNLPQTKETPQTLHFIRRYTTMCQIICYLQQCLLLPSVENCNTIHYELKNTMVSSSFLRVLNEHGPVMEEMMQEWNRSLAMTGVTSKEGRIGDEIVLCVARVLVRKALNSSSASHHNGIKLILTAVAILEHALIQSPYCSYIPLMLIQLHSLLGSSRRSYQLYTSLNVKQVQVESLSFLILNSCSIGGAMFGEISQRCGEILQLHRSSTSSICDYAMDALENGNYTAAADMIRFQTQKMNCSVQLLHAKATIMDLAPLVEFHYPSTASYETTTATRQQSQQLIGSMQGLVGHDATDEARALQILAHSSDRLAAPSIIKECTAVMEARGAKVPVFVDVDAYSDNRDLAICELDVSPTIGKCEYYSDIARLACFPSKKELILSSLSVGHVHAIIVNTTMIISAVKPFMMYNRMSSSKKKASSQLNKKTTVDAPMCSVLQEKCRSLRQALEDAKKFFRFCDEQSDDSNKKTATAFIALRHAFVYLTESLLVACEISVNDPFSISSVLLSSSPASAAVFESMQLANEQIDAASTYALISLKANLSVKECKLVLFDPITLSMVSTLISQRFVALLGALRNLKRIFAPAGRSRTSNKAASTSSEESNINICNTLTRSFMNLISIMQTAIASEPAEIDPLDDGNNNSSGSENTSNSSISIEFLQTSSGMDKSWSEVYLNTVSLVSKSQIESRTVIGSILSELSDSLESLL